MQEPINLDKQPVASATASLTAGQLPAAGSSEMRNFLRATVVLILCFVSPLFRLFHFSLGSELYSYVLLMPVVTWYLFRLQQPRLLPESAPLPGVGSVFAIAALGLMAIYGWLRGHEKLAMEDSLALTTLAFLLALWGAACFTLGRVKLRRVAFPLGMLIFMVPVPNFIMDQIDLFLQYGSADVSEAFFNLVGTPNGRTGLIFMLPGTPGIRVAKECSGIHSTWILLITSLIAGYLFLRSPRNRIILAAAVVPLALLRNGFRIFTIGELCVHIGPQMIDSPIHHQGGPIFFILSLPPFFLLLVWLMALERRKKRNPQNLEIKNQSEIS